MSPEYNEQPGFNLGGENRRKPTDLDLVRAGVNDFYAQNYETDRNPAHSEKVADILEDFGYKTEGLEMTALIHDVVDHGIVSPKSDELHDKAEELINSLYDQVEDKNEFIYAIGCSISASNWEGEVAEAWRVSAFEEISGKQEGDESDIESAILLGAITKNATILDSFPEDIVESVLKSNSMFDLDTEKLRSAMTKLDVEGLILKAAEIMDNLDHPPAGNPASTWRDCTEIFNCYGPALELFGYKALASELRGKALEFYYGDPGGKALHQHNLSQKYYYDVEAQLLTGIEKSGHSSEEFEIEQLDIKSEGSIRKKLHEEGYSDIDLVADGLRSRIIVPDSMSEEGIIKLAKDIQEGIVGTHKQVEPGHPRGEEPFEIRKKEKVGYSAIHLTFIYHTPDGDVPYELQFVTHGQNIEHEVGKASHMLFKSGITNPHDYVLRDMQHIYARAHFLQTQAIKPELNPNTWAQIVKYLPDMDTPFHKAFTLNDSAEGKTVLIPPRLSTLDLSEMAKDIETESELDAIFLPPDKLEVGQFFELISFIDPDLGNDRRIVEAVEFLQSLDLKPRKDGEPTLEGHLLPTAVNAAILAAISGEHLESQELPSEFLAKTITAALLHDTIEEPELNVTKEDISQRFGHDIAETVWSLSTFSEEEIPDEHTRRIEYAKKVASDPKAVLIKLSDRMQNHQTDLVRLNEGVDEEVRQNIFKYFRKTDLYLNELFDTLPDEYKRVKALIWEIAEHFGYVAHA